MLIKHSWRHVDDAGRLCGVCGEQSTSAELLRVHLQSHQKTHSCISVGSPSCPSLASADTLLGTEERNHTNGLSVFEAAPKTWNHSLRSNVRSCCASISLVKTQQHVLLDEAEQRGRRAGHHVQSRDTERDRHRETHHGRAGDILAVVERTVAGYEEEASGFRQEIARQRRRWRFCCSRGSDWREEMWGTLGLWASCVLTMTMKRSSLRCNKRRAADRNEKICGPRLSNIVKSSVEQGKRGRPRISDAQTHLDLRICILEATQSDMLSNSSLFSRTLESNRRSDHYIVFKKCPVRELQCPRGLRESDFLDLLSPPSPADGR
ncbi:hypothetical protein INR49_008365 [Caranx melampygus]|nr:hypothetical protein INR49_008365 [Caranx melampygus]